MNKLDETNLPQMIAQAAKEQSFETPKLDTEAVIREAARRKLRRQLIILTVGGLLMLAVLLTEAVRGLLGGIGTQGYWLAVVIAGYIGMAVPVGLAAVVLFCRELERQQKKGVFR